MVTALAVVNSHQVEDITELLLTTLEKEVVMDSVCGFSVHAGLAIFYSVTDRESADLQAFSRQRFFP
jgi:hypothetical protein